jgi:hypothetical protein
MKHLFRNATALCLFTAMLCAASLLHAQGNTSKIKASAIKVEMIQSDEIHLPAEFQVALYENLIQQLEQKGNSWRIYRDGDRDSANIVDLVDLRSTVRGFKQGSEKARDVTTVAGATSITVHCQFTDNHGKVLLERDINGKVRFFGGNLKATYDFAKKAATVAQQNFSATEQAPEKLAFQSPI